MLKIRHIILLLFAILHGTMLFGENITVVFDAAQDKGSRTVYKANAADTITKNGISIKCTIAALGDGEVYHFYKNSTLTISSEVGNILKVIIYCNSGGTTNGGPSNLKATNYTTEGKIGTWQGDDQKEITFSASLGQCQATKVEVTYDSDIRTKPRLAFAKETYALLYGDTYTSPPLTNSFKVAASFSSSCEDVATIDSETGELSLVGLGETTISACFQGDEAFRPDTASYKLYVSNTLSETIDFTHPSLYGYKLGKLAEGDSFNSGKVSVCITKYGKTATKFSTTTQDTVLWVSQNASMNFQVEEGYLITGISIDAILTSGITLEKDTWKGCEQSIGIDSFFMSGNIYAKSLTIEYTLQNLTFDETKTNPYTTLEKANVKLLRTLSPDYWNTFCSPFDISEEQIQSVWGAGTQLRKYAGDEGNTMKFKEETAIKAGTAYLIKPTKEVEAPVFANVNINSNLDFSDNETGNLYKFKGVIDKTELDETKDLFITTRGTVSTIAKGKNTIKGMRAYIEVTDGLSSENEAKGITLNIEDSPSGVALVPVGNHSQGQNKVFTLGGIYVGNATTGLTKGIYIINGKKESR